MFWTNYVRLCLGVGKSPNQVAAECGVKSSGTVTGWRNGALPRPPVLKQIAEFFSVTIDDLLKDNEKPAPLIGDGLTSAQKELIRLLPLLTDSEVTVLLTTVRSLIDGRILGDSQ